MNVNRYIRRLFAVQRYGVIHAVNAYAKYHGIEQVFVTSDRIPSWLWEKR